MAKASKSAVDEVASDPPLATASPRSSVGDAEFVVEEVSGVYEAKIKVNPALSRSVSKAYYNSEKVEPQRAVRIDLNARTVTIWPQVTYFSEHLYRQKYKRLSEILVDLEGEHSPPEDHDGVAAILSDLSNGFIKDPTFGLGFVMEMRPLVKAIEEIKGVTRLVIAAGEQTRVEADTFFMNGHEFLVLRKGMSRIARTHQQESLTEREIMAHNAANSVALPDKFPVKEPPYKAGTVYKLLGGSQASTTKLRGKDRLGLLSAIATNANDIAKRDPQEFVQLQKDIEIASLDQLIESVEKHIQRNSDEAAWQTLLEVNPFILSMLFGQPIVLLRAGGSVGGQAINGSGTKIVDFLTKNTVTHNAAIVEIKRPRTKLFSREYRGGVHPPSWDLIGAVTQVLDQRLKLVTGMMATRYNNRDLELEVSAVECVVVAGMTPTERDHLSSLELVRNQFKDVRIVTFDEMLERLQLLRELLSGERYVSPDEDDCKEPALPYGDDGHDGDGYWSDDEDHDPWAD
ncbi:Shedu immune nuclease family protein [Alteriqipengyuania lutimaris]|uniref:Shedu immune nuclease family protein n=1 Tax=Alteriqipengyuania lutimaris TaxID=1538146 RepID=UPI001CFD84C7|nr:Shedu immune nuclease family protein [Alteriqipengyuania lutimaris]